MQTAANKKDLIFWKVLEYLRARVLEKSKELNANEKEKTQKEIGKELGISQGAVSLLLSEKRGEGIQLKTAIRAFKGIGGDMAKLLNEVLSQKEASILLALADQDEEFFNDLIFVLEDGTDFKEKLKADLRYYRQHIEKEKK